MPKQNRRRRKRERARQFGALADWVARQPCDNCGRVDGVVPAHVTGRRLGGAWLETPEGPVGNLIPLCDDPFNGGGCHNRQHRAGWAALQGIGSLEVAHERARRYGVEFLGGEAANKEARPPA